MEEQQKNQVSSPEALYESIAKKLEASDSDPELAEIVQSCFLKKEVNEEQSANDALSQIVKLAEDRAKDDGDGKQ